MTEPARITVIAGVNGAGKSSVAGTALRQSGGEYFNPDEVTRAILSAAPALSEEEGMVAPGMKVDNGLRRRYVTMQSTRLKLLSVEGQLPTCCSKRWTPV